MKKRLISLLLALLAAALSFAWCPEVHAAKWTGVDEAVVEKFAKEAGRQPVEPLINTDQGDLLLFVFLVAGAAGGFVGGYYFRKLFHERRDGELTKGNA
jgi:ABC-type cobalt transport system substrate-binding protein